MHQSRNKLIWLLVLGLSFASSFMQPSVFADDREKLLQKLKELEAQKQKMESDLQKKAETTQMKDEDLSTVISKYEALYTNCQTSKSDRCPDIYFQLGKLYYDQGKDDYVKARDAFDKAMDEWERSRKGKQPINPLPDYSKSLNMYRNLISTFPDFRRNDEAYFQIGNVWDLNGEVDSAKAAFSGIIQKFPNSIRASAAHFRLANYFWLDRDFTQAINHLEKIKKEMVNAEIWEQVHYQKAIIYYNRGDYDLASDLFASYIEKCDAGEYPKKDFRADALDYLASCFSDLPGGINEALKFFKKTGARSWEPYVLYAIGKKNRKNGQFDDAIISLNTALKEFPFYSDAPIARNGLVECLVVKRQYDDANKQRELIIDLYSPGTEWYTKNTSNRAAIDQSRMYLDKALGNICIYYNAQAQQKKEKGLYQKALKFYAQYFSQFPENKWKVYEFKYYAAEIYNELGEFNKAVENYWFVANQELAKYPEYVVEVDSLLFDDAKAFEEAKLSARKKGAMVISQEDAGFNAIVALDNLRKKKVQQTNATEQASFSLPETQQMLSYIDAFQKRFPRSSNNAQILFLAGNLYYSAGEFDKAGEVFKTIAQNFPKTDVAPRAARMAAKTYVGSGQFDQALDMYKGLMGQIDQNTKEYQELIDLSAAAIASKAESLRKANNFAGAAAIFKSVYAQFPQSNVSDRSWFEAGVCYEQNSMWDSAAVTFELFATKFKSSTLVEKAFFRAADNYKKANNFNGAANIYLVAATTSQKADYAITSYANASDCYQQGKEYVKAARVYVAVYERFPTDPKAPQALYNAGLLFEKAKEYGDAIKAYFTIGQKFAQSEYAEDGAFSIGLCYEKLGSWTEAATAFGDFAKKYENRSKQVEALIKSGDSYMKAKDFKNAELMFQSGTALYDKFKKQVDAGLSSSVARAYLHLGDVYYEEYKNATLKGVNEKEVKNKLKAKQESLEKCIKPYAKAIETGVQEYVFKATLQIGLSFVDFADAMSNQSLFGSKTDQIGSKFLILTQSEKYFNEAQKKFAWNIDKGYELNVAGDDISKSADLFMWIAYRKGHLYEELGDLLGNAPVPKDMSSEDQQAYREVLEEKKLEAVDKAVPKYGEALQAASELGIVGVPWTDSIKARISEIDPNSEALKIEIKARAAKELPAKQVLTAEQLEQKRLEESANSNEPIGLKDKPAKLKSEKGNKSDSVKKHRFLFFSW